MNLLFVVFTNIDFFIRLLSGDFTRLLLISFLVSIPFTYWIMNGWLNNFAYRVELNWYIFFVFSEAILFTIALVVVMIQTIHASLVNPVDYLRQE